MTTEHRSYPLIRCTTFPAHGQPEVFVRYLDGVDVTPTAVVYEVRSMMAAMILDGTPISELADAEWDMVPGCGIPGKNFPLTCGGCGHRITVRYSFDRAWTGCSNPVGCPVETF